MAGDQRGSGEVQKGMGASLGQRPLEGVGRETEELVRRTSHLIGSRQARSPR